MNSAAQACARAHAVFLYSDFSKRSEAPKLVYESALWLVDMGIRAFGTGEMSIYHDRRSHELHHRKHIAVYDRLHTEGLRSIKGKKVFFIGFPLSIKYLATSPCRVVAFELG